MKVIVPTFGFSFFILVMMIFLGQLMFIAPLEKEIIGFQETAKRFQDEQQFLEAKLAKARPLRPDEAGKPEIRLLKAGEEDVVVQTAFAEASASGIIINVFNMAKPVSVKGAETDNAKAPAVAVTANGNLPQLDANGMPIGSQEVDEPESQDVSLLPIQISLKGTYKSLVKFFLELKKKMPLFVLRKMNIFLDGSGLGKGSVELVFPYGNAGEPVGTPAMDGTLLKGGSSKPDPNETGGNYGTGK